MSASRSTLFTDQCLFLTIFSALLAKRISEKKEKAAAIKASHKKCVSPCLNKSSAQSSWLMSNFQGCVNAGSSSYASPDSNPIQVTAGLPAHGACLGG